MRMESCALILLMLVFIIQIHNEYYFRLFYSILEDHRVWLYVEQLITQCENILNFQNCNHLIY